MTLLRAVRPGLLAASLLVATGLFGIASPAAAVTNAPVALDPYIHEERKAQPDAVTIVFKDLVKPKAYIVVENSAGKNVALGAPRLESTNLSVQLMTGQPDGTYTVKYRIEGTNGPEGGAYQFSIGSGDYTIKGLDTWGGYKAIPKPLRLPGDDADEIKARATPPTATPSPLPEPTPTALTDDKAASGKGDGDPSVLPWAIGVAALILAAVGGVIARRRSTAAGGNG